MLGSSELRGRGYDRFSLTLVGYRAVLNRDPSEDELARLSRAAHGPLAAPLLLARLYASSEFHSLATEICDASEPSYHFGTTAAPTLPTGVVGFTGTQAQLQALLDATPAGGTVRLAAKAVVRLSSPLTVPAGVALTTHGEPDTRHYATMARLVRDPSGGGFEAAMVRCCRAAD